MSVEDDIFEEEAESTWERGRTRREALLEAGAAAAFVAGGSSLMRVGTAWAGVKAPRMSRRLDASPKVNLLHGKTVISDFVTLNREYYKGWHQGARRAVEALGGVYKFAVDDQNPQVQIQHFEQQVKQGNKIFFCAAPDPSTIAPIAKLARDNQAYFDMYFEMPPWGSPFDPRVNGSPYFVTWVAPDWRAQGDAEMTELAKVMGGKGNMIWITGFPGSTPDLELSAGIKQALKRYPNIKVIGSQPGNWLQADSRAAMAGFIRKFGDKIDGIIGQNDDCGIGAAQAYNEAGIKKIPPIVSTNGATLTIEYILRGQYHGTLATYPAWNGGAAAVRVIDAYLGWKPTVPERMMWTGGAMITKENAAGYLKFVSGPDPFNWPLMSRIAHPKDWDPQAPFYPLNFSQWWSVTPQPKGFVYPPEIAQSVKSGEFARISALYKAHYKRKIYGDKSA